MLPDEIYKNKSVVVPDLNLEVLRHVDAGEQTIVARCKLNGIPSSRITQTKNGEPVNLIPVWTLGGRIVAKWFALLLENKYQTILDGQPIIIHPDFG